MENRLFYSKETDSLEDETRAPKKEQKKKNKINFKEKKDNTIKSLNEVEYFLNDFKHFKKYMHLYKFFK